MKHDRLYRYYLGVDGGGTKTTFTLSRVSTAPGPEKNPPAPDPGRDLDTHNPENSSGAPGSDAPPWGDVLGRYTSGCCHYLQIGFHGLQDLIRDGITGLCRQVRQDPSSLEPDFSPSMIDGAFFGLAGYRDVAADDPGIESAVAFAISEVLSDEGASAELLPPAGRDDDPLTVFPDKRKRPAAFAYRLGNDSENALAGALGGKPGINVIAGTGSAAFGRDEKGHTAHCGGWNYNLGGDEGSGFWIARELLHRFQRQSDGRDEKTILHSAVLSELELSSDDSLVTKVVGEWDFDRTRIAGLSRLAAELAKKEEPHARDILLSAARELSDYAVAIKGRLDFQEPVRVSGTGGIFNTGSLFTDEFARILKENGMHYVKALYTPDIGSLILARRIQYSCSAATGSTGSSLSSITR